MAQYVVQIFSVVPGSSKRFEDMNELEFAQAVQVSNYSIKFADHVFFAFGIQWTVGNPHRLGPFSETIIRTSQTPGERNNPLPSQVVP